MVIYIDSWQLQSNPFYNTILLGRCGFNSNLIWPSVFIGTGRETKRVCLRGNLFSNLVLALFRYDLPYAGNRNYGNFCDLPEMHQEYIVGTFLDRI